MVKHNLSNRHQFRIRMTALAVSRLLRYVGAILEPATSVQPVYNVEDRIEFNFNPKKTGREETRIWLYHMANHDLSSRHRFRNADAISIYMREVCWTPAGARWFTLALLTTPFANNVHAQEK